jgi:rubrerythrin
MPYCVYCSHEIKIDDDFILVGMYPSDWTKWSENLFPSHGNHLRKSSPEDFGTIYHKSCFLEMVKSEIAKQFSSSALEKENKRSHTGIAQDWNNKKMWVCPDCGAVNLKEDQVCYKCKRRSRARARVML